MITTDKNRREYYRLIYPIDCRPKLLLRGEGLESEEYEVIDIGIKGVRVLGEGGSKLSPDLKVNMLIFFLGAEPMSVEGGVIRVDDREIALYFTRNIPFSMIEREQKRLMDLGYLRFL